MAEPEVGVEAEEGGSGGRGGRGGSQTQSLRTLAARRRMGRPKVSVLGPKQRSK